MPSWAMPCTRLVGRSSPSSSPRSARQGRSIRRPRRCSCVRADPIRQGARCHPGPGPVPRRGAGARSRLLGRAGKLPPSLRKIRKELERAPEVAPPEGGNLEGWARQGVLLLNTVLTVRAGAPNSHRARGWEDFTDAVISAVNKKSDCVVFLLWGAAAQKKAGLVTNETHRVIRAAHPAARASA